MADVLISIEMLKQIYHVDESDLEGWVNFKVNRRQFDNFNERRLIRISKLPYIPADEKFFEKEF